MESEFTAILTEDNQIIRNMYNTVFNPLTFFREVDWTEPWLLGLLMFHVLIIALSVISRNYNFLHGILFMAMLTLVICAQYINQVAANNWKYFAYHQYFDSNGMFISIVFSIPLLFNCLIIIGRWLYISGCMTIKIKQAQLRERMRAESRLRRQAEEEESSEQRRGRRKSRSTSRNLEQNRNDRADQSVSDVEQDHSKKE